MLKKKNVAVIVLSTCQSSLCVFALNFWEEFHIYLEMSCKRKGGGARGCWIGKMLP